MDDEDVIVIDDDEERSPTNNNEASLKKESSRIQPIFSSKNEFQLPPRPSATATKKKKKKSVHFHDKLTTALHPLLNVPLASEMATHEKHRIWYNANEYDQFKYQAAKEAGVKVVRYDSVKVGNPNFVMMGDFDGSLGSDNAKKSGKCHYNENEYNDQKYTNSDEVICKRGLGYHFSRSRKKSQKVARSAVMAWQKTLRNQSPSYNTNNLQQQQDLPSNTEKKKNHLEKSRMMLALVSTKCSRKAREEAKWRGDVDYRVAHPERHDPRHASCNSGSIILADAGMIKGKGKDGINNNANNSIMANNHRKRSAGENNVVDLTTSHASSVPTPSYKRQRRAGCYNREQLSPTTIGYMASGVLQQAEV